MNESISDGAVCRTAPATPGLLKMQQWQKQIKSTESGIIKEVTQSRKNTTREKILCLFENQFPDLCGSMNLCKTL